MTDHSVCPVWSYLVYHWKRVSCLSSNWPEIFSHARLHEVLMISLLWNFDLLFPDTSQSWGSWVKFLSWKPWRNSRSDSVDSLVDNLKLVSSHETTWSQK